MLSPDDRVLLVDLLAPSEAGYRLEHAVATTFTLDLTALLSIPLALAGADVGSSPDPLSIIQAVSNYTDRIDVFGQAGQIAVPARDNPLLAFLEKMVHQVKAPRPGRLFHPKLWVLRFSGADDDDEIYRLVCGSRNLTGDKAWDAVISLEGRRTGRPRSVNRPVATFLESLADRVQVKLPRERRLAIADLIDGLRRVEWERPPGALADDEWLKFHVFGPDRRARPDMGGHRRLVVSPFINDDGLELAWPGGRGECTILSRPETLDALGVDRPGRLQDHAELRVLDESAAIPSPESEDSGPQWSLSGLHAKLYIVERDRRAHVFVGSANATDAAWRGNDELLVEIVGRPAVYGIGAALDDKSGFGGVLLAYSLGEPAAPDPDEELRHTLENALRDLAALSYTATVDAEPEATFLRVASTEVLRAARSLPPDARLSIEPLTLNGQAHQARFGRRFDQSWRLSREEEITPFLVLHLESECGIEHVEVSTIAMAHLVGDPADRLDRLLAGQVETPEKFLRFAMLMLELSGDDPTPIPEPSFVSVGSVGHGSGSLTEEGLLEAVLRALTRSPSTIDELDRLAARLTATDAGRKVLPDGWDSFWPSVLQARQQLGKR